MTIYEKADANQAKINELRPFEGHMLKQLQDYYRVGLTWSSNALEGNTLTISETKVVLEDGLTIGGRPIRDFYETIGHGKAYDFMFTLIKDRSITIEDIKTMHRMFYRDIDEVNAGEWRETQIVVSGSEYAFPEPQEIESFMQELESWIETERDNYHPVEFAALLHLKFVTIHPFIDGNGRTARLIMNLALIQDGYMLGIIPPICRTEYNAAIRKYQNSGNTSEFCEFIGDRVYETQKEAMRLFLRTALGDSIDRQSMGDFGFPSPHKLHQRRRIIVARMECKCGHTLSTTQVPNEIEYHVYSDFEWVKIEENDTISMIDFPSAAHQVWKCPQCERVYVFNWGYGPAIRVYNLEEKSDQ